MLLVGYHYTSLDNWLNIQHDGLVPYKIDKPELYEQGIKEPVDGIWLWPNKLSGKDHVGVVIYQLSVKNTMKVVELQVVYNSNHRFRTKEDYGLNIKHYGDINSFRYHDGVPSIIVTAVIPPKDITLHKVYDLEELLS